MTADAAIQIAVEHRRDRTYERATELADVNALAAPFDKAVVLKRAQPREIGRDGRGERSVVFDFAEIDREVAHQAPDNLGSEGIFDADRDAARGGEPAVGDRLAPVRRARRVLHITARQPTD